jgi:hypothetical protein
MAWLDGASGSTALKIEFILTNMNRLFGLLTMNLLRFPAKEPVYSSIKDLKRVVVVENDGWNGFQNGEYIFSYFDGKEEVARSTFRIMVGQIGSIWTKYHNYDNPLREEILCSVVETMAKHTTPPKTVWEAAVSKDDYMYKKWGFTWSEPAHFTVTGAGWSHNLSDLYHRMYNITEEHMKPVDSRGGWLV